MINTKDRYQIIVIGAGSGGLVVAIGAAKSGKTVLLIERGTYGGDCTNFGCIPSKSLIASAEVAHAISQANAFGLEGVSSFSETKQVFQRVRNIVHSIRSQEEPPALKEKGVNTLTGTAHFIDAHHLQIIETTGVIHEVYGEKIVIATGSSPLIPDIEGLGSTPYLTNETIFDLQVVPKRFCILGGGPIGCEMAQAFSRLGSKVTQIHRYSHLLNKEEPAAQELIGKNFLKEGIELFLAYETKSMLYSNNEFKLTVLSQKESKEIFSDALLIAVGRKPNIELLHLETAGIRFSKEGIEVDKFGRTSQKHIWAIGDVVKGGPRFTHAAENQARKVLISFLLPIKMKRETQAMPRVTFTDPEVASFGLLEKEAEELYGKNKISVYHVPFAENDRAITAGKTDGFVKVVTKKMSSQILGATIVGVRAGEMIPELFLAAKEKIPLRKLASLIHPYPIYNLAIRKAADFWLTQTFLPWLKNPLKDVSWKRFLPFLIILMLMIFLFFGRSQVFNYCFQCRIF
jgi:pyruvate/2-oxoglutarate dehydrogenase complex dihydrolipoamide dehydrogenase (E3) component